MKEVVNMNIRCEWCQEESKVLIPVVNRNPLNPSEHELVCPDCAVVEADEHGGELFWSAVNFKDLVTGRIRAFELVA